MGANSSTSLEGENKFPTLDRENALFVDHNYDEFKPRMIRNEENTIRLYLLDFKKSIIDWTSLIGMILSLVVALTSNAFASFLGFPPEFWKSLFLISLIISLLRLGYAVYIKFFILNNKDEIEIFIERIKRGNR